MNKKGFGVVAIIIIVAAILIAGGIIYYYKFYSAGEFRYGINTYSPPIAPLTVTPSKISPDDISPSVIVQPINNADLVATSSLGQPGMIDQGPVPGNVEITPTSIAVHNPLSIQDFQTIVAWLQSYGLTVTDSGVDADGFAYINAMGKASQFDAAFHTQLQYFFDGQTQFIGVKGSVEVPAALAKAMIGPVFPPPGYPA